MSTLEVKTMYVKGNYHLLLFWFVIYGHVTVIFVLLSFPEPHELAEDEESSENIIESEHVGAHPFATMTGDQDVISQERLQDRSPEEEKIFEQQKT